MQSQEIIEQMEGDVLDAYSPETFSQPEYRFLAQLFNTGIADNFTQNMMTHNLGFSQTFINGIINWLTVYGHPLVALSNQTHREKEFELEAEIALYNIPRMRSDLNNPHVLNILELCKGQFKLSASKATGPRRLEIRMSEKTTRIYSADETEHSFGGRKRKND